MTEQYGADRYEGRPQKAHRVAYQREVGPIPPGMVIHHVCGEPRCVNVEHMQLVTRAEHVRLHRVIDGRCQRGHDMTDPANVYVTPDGRRNCRTCRAAARRRYQARKEAELA
jgi:hypothetical protein